MIRMWIDTLKTAAIGVVFVAGLCDSALAQRGGMADPYGCRARIRAEMGIAPYTGNQYPGFWTKVDNCLRRAGGGGNTEANERSVRQKAERAAAAKLAAEAAKKRKAETAAAKPAQASKSASAPAVQPAASVAAPVIAVAPVVASTPAVVPAFGRRVALVIGNSKYEHVGALPNAINDAKALASSLEATGFQSVTLKYDLSRDQLATALSEFARVADSADWAAVYYSGHGIEYRGTNYMIPVDARLKVDRDIDLEAVDVGKVSSAIDGARKLRLIILDACRDNPFMEQMKRSVATRSITRGLGRVEPDAGTLIVYAAKHGEIALDGDGSNSPFAAALLQRIQTPNIELRRLFDLVRDDVMAVTNRRQQPYSYGSLSGSEDFYFLTK